MVIQHAGAAVGAQKADAAKSEADLEVAKATAKETEARAGVIQGIADRHGELIHKGNVDKIFHPPAAEPQGPNLAGAKATAKKISPKS